MLAQAIEYGVYCLCGVFVFSALCNALGTLDEMTVTCAGDDDDDENVPPAFTH